MSDKPLNNVQDSDVQTSDAQKPDAQEPEEFLSTLAFELEQETNLAIDPSGDEKSNAVIDMLRLQFVDLHKKLDDLSFASDEAEKKAVAKDIRAWVNSLNVAPLIPLPFRLKTLKRLEDYLDILSDDMGGLILRAYKIGIVHVRAAARQDPQLYTEVVHVVATALELAIHQLVKHAKQYCCSSPIEIRQNLDIAKLGLVVARSAPKACRDEAVRLKCIVAEHELLRRIDLFAYSVAEQKTIIKHVSMYAMFIDSMYVRKGKSIPYKKEGMYLLTQLGKPHLKPHRTTRLPAQASGDTIVMYAQGMAKRAVEDLERVREAEMMATRDGVFNLEVDLEETKLVCNAIVKALKVQKIEERKAVAKSRISIDVLVGIDTGDDATSNKKLKKGWVLHNLSEHGAMLQCPVDEGHVIPVGSVLTFYWSKDTEYPRYAIVRWVQASLQGYQRLGVEFVQGRVKPAVLHFINIRSAVANKREWPALMVKTQHGWQVWMQTKERHHTPLTVSIETGSAKDEDICRIYPIQVHGYNYSVFRITEVLSMEEVKAMALMQGKEEKKSVKDLDF